MLHTDHRFRKNDPFSGRRTCADSIPRNTPCVPDQSRAVIRSISRDIERDVFVVFEEIDFAPVRKGCIEVTRPRQTRPFAGDLLRITLVEVSDSMLRPHSLLAGPRQTVLHCGCPPACMAFALARGGKAFGYRRRRSREHLIFLACFPLIAAAGYATASCWAHDGYRSTIAA